MVDWSWLRQTPTVLTATMIMRSEVLTTVEDKKWGGHGPDLVVIKTGWR